MKTAAVMPTFNADRYLVEAIRSVLRQTDPNLTLFVIDGGSSDATVDICKVLQRTDKRIVILERPNTTPTQRVGEFLEGSEFDIYFMTHADDLSYADRFEAQIRVLSESPGALIAGSWVHYWLHEKDYSHDMPHDAGILRYPLRHEEIVARLPFWWCFSIPSLAINGTQMRSSGLRLDNRFNLASDWWFYWEAAKVGLVANIDRPLISYRQHLSGHGATNREELLAEVRNIRMEIARDMGLTAFLTSKELDAYLDIKLEYDNVQIHQNSESLSILVNKLAEFSPNYINISHWRAILSSITSKLEFSQIKDELDRLKEDYRLLQMNHDKLKLDHNIRLDSFAQRLIYAFGTKNKDD